MGTYLSTPIVEKDIDSGQEEFEDSASEEKLSVSWSCVEMQGWRKSMEDAHIAHINVRNPGWIKTSSEECTGSCRIFGAFDGHGGGEVARFCREHFVKVLTKRDEWAQGDIGKALTETFFQLDRMIDNPQSHEQLLLFKNAQHQLEQPPDNDNNAVAEDAEMTHKLDASHILEKIMQKAVATSPASDPSPEEFTPHQQEEDIQNNSNPNSSMTLTKSPTRIVDGRQVCNLPDHPIHAGCTSIVCVISGNDTLTVANAGDSRAVLCRGKGQAMPLSTDHKPLSDGEMLRIQQSGGFVNHFGRINGNLNVSRSIGDLKYKQAANILPSKQMITADPDILQVYLLPDDDFVIIGCDGIWDCITNQDCVNFVRQRIDNTPLSDIGVELLDKIVSKDPRATQGIGGDNMTFLIVDLKSKKRSKLYSNEHHANPIDVECAGHDNNIVAPAATCSMNDMEEAHCNYQRDSPCSDSEVSTLQPEDMSP